MFCQIILVQVIIIVQLILKRLRHIRFHLIGNIPDILTAVRVARHDARRHQVVSGLQAEAVLYRVRVGGIDDFMCEIIPRHKNGSIRPVTGKRFVAAVFTDRHVLPAQTADRAVIFQIINADRPVDSTAVFLSAVIQEQTSDLLRYVGEAVVYRHAVECECALDVLYAVVHMLYAVMRRLIKQTVNQRFLRVAGVIQDGRLIIFTINIRLCIDFDAVDVDLAELRFSERTCRNRLGYIRRFCHIHLQLIPSVKIAAICKLEICYLFPECFVDFSVLIQAGILIDGKRELRSADQ